MELMPDWDKVYAAGIQDGSEEKESSPRFAMIGGFCTQAGAIEILDVGCGTGLLRASLCPCLSRYTGLDCSSVAIQCLQGKGGGDFICADAEQWIPSRHYDAVILNEVLYYFKDPRQALSKYYAALRPDGIFIISIFNKQPRFWRLNSNRSTLAVVEQFLPHAPRYDVSDGKNIWTVVVCKKMNAR
jgi:2-polyprenyl-3-methyl-5-hydroxy-6-metoxy-1,4-benzoquinol methylase